MTDTNDPSAPPDIPVSPLLEEGATGPPSSTCTSPEELDPLSRALDAADRRRARWCGPPGAGGRPIGVRNGEGKGLYNPNKVNWWYERLADWMIANPHLNMKDCARDFHKSHNWILQLKNSDTFQRYWRERSGSASAEFIGGIKAKAYAAGEAALDILNEKLETVPETFSVGSLLEVVDTTMKRFGDSGAQRAPAQQVNVNIGLVSPNELQAARERMRQRLYGDENEVSEAEEVDSGGWSDG